MLDHARPLPLPPARPRVDTIDLVRGLVMALMVIDHVRDYLGGSAVNPRDVADPALFLTRAITHLCAPTFVLLAGVSAYLYGARGRTRGEISRFLLSRGLWLVVLELTIVRVGWTFQLEPDFVLLQVVWAIGGAMIALAALVHLPRAGIVVVGVALVAGHNLLDPISATDLGGAGWLWNLAHEPAQLAPEPGLTVFALYPLLPWIGVLALGYALGPVFRLPAPERRRWLVGLGGAALATFVILRGLRSYGDPAARIEHDELVPWLLSFIDCEKYPPSLQFLAMTLGAALVLLAVADRARGRLVDAIVALGRVPLAFYVGHVFLIHAVAIGYALLAHGDAGWLVGGFPPLDKPAGYGVGLPAVYVVSLGVVAALYPLCRWFGRLKQRRTDWWLSYL